MLASGRIVATSVPLRLRMLSTDIVSPPSCSSPPPTLGIVPVCKGRPEEVDVRFTPENRHVRCTNPCPLWANSGHSCRSHSLRLRFQSPVWCNPKFNDFWQATKVVRQLLRIFSFDRHSWCARYVVADGAVTQSQS